MRNMQKIPDNPIRMQHSGVQRLTSLPDSQGSALDPPDLSFCKAHTVQALKPGTLLVLTAA